MGPDLPRPDPTPRRLIITLSLAGLLSGVSLASVYEVASPRIAANKAARLQAAVFKVVPQASSMRACIVQDGQLVELDGAPPAGTDAVYATFDASERLVGWAIPAAGPGFQDAIHLIYGYDATSRKIIGMQVLESRETPGLGDKILKDAAFAENFKALSVDPEIQLVKRGAKTAANQVDGITGATISSRAVVNILNASNARWLTILQQEGTRRDTDS